MKAKTFLGFGLVAMGAVAAIAVATGVHKNEMTIGTVAEDTVYNYNHLNFDGRIDGAATGNQFKGVDGHHFEISSCLGTKDWHVTLFNYDGDWTLTVDKQYKLSFEYKINSATADEFKFVSSCRFVKAEPEDKPDAAGIYGEYVVERANYGKYLTSEHTFTAKVVHPEIDIHLGKNAGAFDVFIRRIVVTEVDTKDVVSETYLESPGDFAKRWNTANEGNEGKALCTADEAVVKELLKRYSELVPWVRNDVNVLVPANDPSSTLGAQIAYFASRVHVSFNS